MNKVLFNIIAWPLLLAISFFVAFGIGQQKKLSADNTNLSAMLAQIQQENETLKNNSSKQTSGVMTGIFRIHPNGEDVTLPNDKVIEVSGDQYYVFEETEMYLLGDKKESTTFQLSLKDNKVIVTQGDAPFMELTPDYDKEWYTVEVNGTTQYFKKTTEREFYLEFLGQDYKEDLAGSQAQIKQLERIRDVLNNEISSAKGQSTGAMVGTYFSDDLSMILEIKENTFSLYAFDEETNKYVAGLSNFPFELQGNNIVVSGETAEAGTVDLVFVPNYYTDSYSLEGQDIKFIQLPKLLEKYITEGKFTSVSDNG